jgi:glucosamine 6-phosphate synthetase-like amidotransferase/phosphosugar isomerase protein
MIMDQLEINERNERLLTYILSLTNADNWKQSLDLTDKSLQVFDKEQWLSEVDTIYLVGHGTSLATAFNAASWFSHIAKIYAQAIPAFQFNHYVDDYVINPQKTIVVGVSCSGNTESVVQSLENANRRGAITICLSGKEDMNCAKVAKYRIITDAHKEISANISPYTISHIFLLLGAYQLAIILGNNNGSLDSNQVDYWHYQLDEVISTMKCLPDISKKMREISDLTKKFGGDNFVVLGTGPNFGTMKEGSLKISELSWKFGSGEELEDFAHGRFREVDSKTPLLIISPAGKPYEKTMDILAGCSISETPTIVLTDNRTIAMEKLATYIVDMPKLQDEYLTPFLYIFPLWFYGFYLRKLEGLLAGEIRHNLLAVDINFKANFNESGEKI